jgi:hypothetical protein
MKIFVEFDVENEKFVLMCDDGRMHPMPAGQRLFRAPPHPDVVFSSDTMEGAEENARKLRVYLGGLAPKKHSKKELRAHAD